MTVSLSKGGNVSLSKEAGGRLRHIAVELGWDAPEFDNDPGKNYDLDGAALKIGANNKILGEDGFVFYSSRWRTADNGKSTYYVPDGDNPYGRDLPSDKVGAVVGAEDNTTGADDGVNKVDEAINIDLDKVEPECAKILIPVSIFEGKEKNQSFGSVRDAFVEIRDTDTGKSLARFDLSEDMGSETCMVFGEVYRKDGDWKFKAIEAGFNDGLGGLARAYGVNVK